MRGMRLIGLLVAHAVVIAALPVAMVGEAADSERLPPREQPMSYGGGLEWSFHPQEDCTVYVREYGRPDRPTWVILHGGWGAEHSYLLDVFAGLESDFHLVFYDQRGSLRSQCEAESITADAHVDDLEELRAELGEERINLAAHSMGTHLAGRYRLAHPDRVGQVVLMSPAHQKHPLDEAEQAIMAPLLEDQPEGARVADVLARQLRERDKVARIRARHGLDGDDLGARERTLGWRLEFAAPVLFDVGLWQQVRGGSVFYSAEAAQRSGASMYIEGGWDFPAGWREHDFPVTVIVGDHDYSDWQGRMNRHWFEDAQNVDVVVLPEAGHNAWLDRPAAFRKSLAEAMR